MLEETLCHVVIMDLRILILSISSEAIQMPLMLSDKVDDKDYKLTVSRVDELFGKDNVGQGAFMSEMNDINLVSLLRILSNRAPVKQILQCFYRIM